MVERYPALKDDATYLSFLRKWEYLFAYAGAGFAKGYITCHMLTFVRAVSVFSCPSCDRPLISAPAPLFPFPERCDRRV